MRNYDAPALTPLAHFLAHVIFILNGMILVYIQMRTMHLLSFVFSTLIYKERLFTYCC
jgi:hypothetical protein